MKLCGIYRLTHTETGRYYIGQSTDILRRWKQHEKATSNTKIAAAIRAYGWSAFTAEIIELCDRSKLAELESKYITQHASLAPNGFNLTTGEEVKKFSEETKRKISEANRRRVVSEATKEKLRLCKSTKDAIAHARKMGESRKGAKLTDEHKAKISESSKALAHINIPRLAEHNKGSKRTPEQKERIKAVHVGAKRSDETRARISAALKGKLLGRSQTDEHRKNVSAALMGHAVSDETRAKISAKAKLRGRESYERLTAAKEKKRLLSKIATITAAGDLFAEHGDRQEV